MNTFGIPVTPVKPVAFADHMGRRLLPNVSESTRHLSGNRAERRSYRMKPDRSKRRPDKLVPVSASTLEPAKVKTNLPWWKQLFMFFGWKPKVLKI